MRKSMFALAAMGGLLTFGTGAHAAVYEEFFDTHQLLEPACSLVECLPQNIGTASAISGSLVAPLDVDLYQVNLQGGGTFSARVTSAGFDSQLFLFDSAGRGVYGNDQANGTDLAHLPAHHALTPMAAGTYYLAISAWDVDPLSGFQESTPPTCFPIAGCFGGNPGHPGNPMFPDSNVFDAVLAPTAVGGSAPLNWWKEDTFSQRVGAYTIELTGIAVAVPEPETYAMLLAGLGLIGFTARRRLSAARS